MLVIESGLPSVQPEASPNACTNTQMDSPRYELFSVPRLYFLNWRFIELKALPFIFKFCPERQRKDRDKIRTFVQPKRI